MTPVDQGHPATAALLEGESLGARLSSRGTLTPADLNKIFGEVARGIGQAHAMRVVHRDVKPDNIFIVREGEHEVTKLIDFGIAKVKTDALEFTQIIGTKLGTLLGTPQYMSPEQVRGSAALDYRTDLWALAIIACECLTGRYPFPGTTLGDLTVQICTERPRAPSSLGHVPSGFDQWFFKGTSKKPSQRFSSVEEMAAALDRILSASVPSTLASASSRWPFELGRRVEAARWWFATGRLSPLSTRVRHTIGGWGARLGRLAPTLYGAVFAVPRTVRLGLERPVGSRARLFAAALLLVGSGLAISLLPRRAAPERALREQSTELNQAASPAPARVEGSPWVALSARDERSPSALPVPSSAPASEAPAVAEPPASVAEAPASEAPAVAEAPAAESAAEPAKLPTARRPSKRPRLPIVADQTPLGPMSVAMGEAGARIANGGARLGGVRPGGATPAKARAPAKKAPARALP